MKLEKDTEKEVRKIYEIWLNSYLNGDVETYDYYLDDAYHFIGSTNNEEFLNRKDTTEFFKLTAEQLAGKMDLRNDNIALEYFNELVFITHSCDTWFLNDSEWVYYGRFRCSSVLKEKEEGWRFIYQHFSTTDSKTDEGETIGFDKVNAENQELREAIKRRTVELELKNRELEIEAALERVRSASMAMHKSDELIQVVRILDKEILGLGIEVEGTQIITDFTDQEKGLNDWFAREGFDYLEKFHVPDIKHPITEKIIKAISKGSNFYTETLSNADKDDYFKLLFKYSDFKKLPIKRQGPVYKAPGWVRAVVLSENSILIFQRFNLKEFSKDEEEIFKRFGKVFEQAYTRFLDLQKAEAQVKEAQIEAALERVRSSAMAMHSSEDLHHVAEELRKQIGQLDYKDLETCAIHLYDESPDYFVSWAASLSPNSAADILHSQNYFPKKGVSVLEELIARYQSDDKDYVVVNEGEKMVGFLEMLKKIAPETFKVVKNTYKDFAPKDYRSFWTVSDFKGGSLLMTTLAKPDASTHKLLRRFADVFGLAYRRFADLKKAETQAKEAQIEASLERVRSKTMAMHNSKDVGVTVATMYEELKRIGFDTFRFGIAIFHEHGIVDAWTVRLNKKEGSKLLMGNLDTNAHAALRGTQNAWANNKEIFVYELKGQDLIDYYEAVNNYPDYPIRLEVDNLPERQFFSTFIYNESGLFAFTRDQISSDQSKIIKRFSKVFGQTYRRYQDLIKAEAQAREAQIEASLERVRSKTMAMHSSQDVGNTMVLLFEELETLGIKANRNGIIILDEEEHGEIWTAQPNINNEIELMAWQLDMSLHDLTKQVYKAWKNKNLGTVYPLIGDDLITYYKTLNKYTDIPVKFNLDSFPDREWCYTFNFNEGFIYLFTDKEIIQGQEQIPGRFASVFGQTYRRYQDLKKAEAQARESQIEVALEKVRSASMAMHSSQDHHKVVTVVFEQLAHLGVSAHSALIFENTEDRDAIHFWAAANGQIYLMQVHVPVIENPMFKGFFDALDNSVDFFRDDVSKKDKDQFFKHYFKNSSHSDVPKERQKFILAAPGLSRSTALYNNTALSVMRYEKLVFTSEENTIIKRFGAAFDQSYTRFLDLQKAEAQAREAQIEAALERIRSRSMAMHKTSELSEVIIVLFKQFELLNLVVDTCYIDIFDQNNQGFNFWIGAGTAIYPKEVTLPYFDHPIHQLNRDARQNGIDFFTFDEDQKSKEKYFEHFYPNAKGIDVPEERKQHIANGKGITGAAALGKYSGITMFNYQKIIYSNEENDILIRVNKVFQQTYTRFLDLQKAEAQAREAQIEAAVERVRSRSMAMHHSNELRDVVNTLHDELRGLKVNFHVACIQLLVDESPDLHLWIGTADGVYGDLVYWPYIGLRIFNEFYEARLKKSKVEVRLTKAETNEFFEEYFKLEGVPVERKAATASVELIDIIGFYQTHTCVFLMRYTEGSFSQDERIIAERFAKVFEQTYTRFLDLQKAEAREKEAIKQASLDRVRAEIASMRDAKDLERITPLVWKELRALGVPFFRCGVMLVNEKDSILDFYLSNPEGKALAALHLDFDNSDISRNGVDHWRRKETYIEHWNQEEFLTFMKSLLDQGQISNAATYQGGEKAPEALTLQFVPFTQGMVYVGSESDLSKEELDLVKALGRSLSVAYARYEDFTKLDLAKAKAEKALTELKSAQEQLVQQEKLASLGQLTAGIAHEIKNPLNFVNNFSELSRELIEEVFEELENITDSEAKEEIMAILNDVKSNLTKVHEHGTRANGIVSSMLQHSRASGSKREPKAFNPLVKEFVNLSFHGMRAGKAPINVDIALQLDPKVGDVTLISEDFSRVILNLCNNAFDAMRDKLKTEDGRQKTEAYLPKLSVKTSLQKDKVLLSITDNGGGIPAEIKDKILQPFFTTKKGTEGTGLGLSITNDIVKAHGGELKIITHQEKGTSFNIELPIK